MESQKKLKLVSEDDNIINRMINPNALIKQDNRIINGRWKMNLNQSRLFLAAVSLIEKDDKQFNYYRIKTKDLIDLVELKGRSLYQQLNRDVPLLLQSVIATSSITSGGKRMVEWHALMSTAKYEEGGDLLIKFNEDMKPFLLEVKSNFSLFKLKELMAFKNKYTLRFYLLLKQFEKEESNWRYMTIDEIRDKFDFKADNINKYKKDLYTDYYDLKRRVLLPVLKELGSIGFNVDMKEIKIKKVKKVFAIEFSWNKEKERQEDTQLNLDDNKLERLLIRLKNYGLSKMQIKYIATMIDTAYSLQELNRYLYSLDERIRDKEIPKSKIGGYVYVCFKKQYNFDF